MFYFDFFYLQKDLPSLSQKYFSACLFSKFCPSSLPPHSLSTSIRDFVPAHII